MARSRSTTLGSGDASEAFRVLRSSLLVALSDVHRPSVMVTSATPAEGKTMVCAHLAVSLAEAGMRVIVVDVDLRRPALHRWLGTHNEVGLADVLLEEADLDRALQPVPIVGRAAGGLYVLPTGRTVNDATELIGSTRTARLFDVLSDQADILLFDTPPVLPVADSLVVGRLASGALIVIEARRTPTASVQQAKNALTRNQTRLLGVVLNRVSRRDLSPTYGYGDDGTRPAAATA